MSSITKAKLSSIRLDARHGGEPICVEEMDYLCFDGHVTPEQVRAAEAEGRAMRAAGHACLCPACAMSDAAAGLNETLRCNYAWARDAELKAAGVLDPAQRSAQLRREIGAGAALQATPVRVIRTGGAG